MSSDTLDYNTSDKKVKRVRPKKSGVVSINLAVAKEKVKSVKDWANYAWSPPLADALNAVAKDVAAGRLPEAECRAELLSACRFACETVDQDFDSIEADVEEVIGGAIANARADLDEALAAKAIHPDTEQPEWLPVEGDFFVSGRSIYRRGTDRIRLVSSKFEITARYTGAGHGWIVAIDGSEVQVPANIGELRSSELTSLLVANGLKTDESLGRHDDLLALFKRSAPTGNIKIVPVGGWQADRRTFVFPDKAYGPGAGDAEYRIERSSDHRFHVAGTFEAWQSEVAAPCLGNDLLIFAMSTAAAAPFAGVIPNLPGFFNLEGLTSSGKSTALHVAGSFWGGSNSTLGYAGSWNTTANALIGRAIQNNDALTCLDELGTARAKDVAESVYQISMGQGRARMRASKAGTIENATLERFNALALSTGELSIEAKVGEGGGTFKGGQDIRAINIVVGDETGLPIFEEFHDASDARDFSETIGGNARAIYGHAARSYVEQIAADHAKALSRLTEIALKWTEKHVLKDLPSEIRRAAARFAAVAGAGELAIEFGILPWPKGTVYKSVGRIFLHWLGGRSIKPKDQQVGEDKLRTLLARNDSRFAREVRGDGGGSIWSNLANRFGILTSIDGVDCYAVSQDVIKHELRDTNVPALLKQLVAAGVIKRDTKHMARVVRTPEGRSRLICVARTFVHSDIEDDGDRGTAQIPFDEKPF